MAWQSLFSRFPRRYYRLGEWKAGMVVWNWWWNTVGTSWLGKLFCFSMHKQTSDRGIFESILFIFGRWWGCALDNFKEVIADLDPKQFIVSLHVPLWWIVANGFMVTRIHRVVQFDQKPYYLCATTYLIINHKTFIETFVSKCSEVKTKDEKEIYKLILNSAFGKMCKIVRDRNSM